MIAPLQHVAQDQLDALCRRWRVRELSLFGSVARGEARLDSDIDVLVTFEPEAGWSLLDLVEMRDELAALFGREVDLVEESALRNPIRRRAILRDKRILHAACGGMRNSTERLCKARAISAAARVDRR